jgi:hypothetical protein
MYIICINTNVEKEMKKLLDLGFKKVPTEDGFVMYELNPAALRKSQVTSDKPQATSGKQQAGLTRLNKGLYRRNESKRSR